MGDSLAASVETTTCKLERVKENWEQQVGKVGVELGKLS